MKIKELLEEIIEKAGTGEGSRGGKVVGHTASGKPIYYSAGNSNHKKFSKQDHADAALAHSSIRSRLSDEYHAQHNGDGTFSEKHRKRKAQLQKLIEHHHAQQQRHADSYSGDKPSPDQKDFDRMDRQNDPQKRSRAWGRKSMESPMKELSSLGFTVGDAPSLVKSEQSTIDTEKVSNHLPTRQGMEKSSQERLEEQLTKGSVELSTPTMMVILRTPKQEKRKQPRIEELDKQHGEEFHGKEIPLADVDHQVEEVERSLSKEELVLKALDEIGDLDKSKYIRREGGPGNYKYTYKEPVGRQPAAESAPQAESSPQPQNEAREKYKRKELKKLETNLKSLEFAVGSAKSWIKKYGSVSNIPKNERDRFHSINLVEEQNKVTRQLRAMSISSIDVPKEMASKRDSLFREVEALSKLNKSESVEMPKDKFVAEHKKLVGVLESPSKKDDKKEAKEQKKELKEVEKGKDRCWDGYKPTPGKKPYSEGSCTKKAEDEKFDFDGNKKPDAHEKQHKKIAEKLDKKKVDKSLDSLVEMLSDQTDMRKLKRVHENTVQRPQVPYQFVRSMGKGGIVFNFGTKTGNIFADKATELLTQNADPIQQATVQNQDQAYQKALDSYVQTGQATFEMQTSNEKTLEKGFDQQVKEAYENGTLYDDPSKPAVQNEYNKAQLKMNGEVIKATSETDAALIEMMQSQSDTENDGSVVIDATQGGKQSVTVEC